MSFQGDIITDSMTKTKEETLKQLQDLRKMLEELYAKNTKLDEENCSLKKEVRSMKGQIGTALDTMKGLKEDLQKAREILNSKPKMKSNVELTA